MAVKLSAKQEAFCQEYLIDLCAKQAAIRAGYSPKSAEKIGYELLQNTRVRARVDELLAERSRRTGINADRVIRELARLAFIDPTQLIDSDGAVKPDATPDDRAAIACVRVKRSSGKDGESVEREVRVADKLKALELLGKHLTLFADRLQVDASAIVQIVDDIPAKPGNPAGE